MWGIKGQYRQEKGKRILISFRFLGSEMKNKGVQVGVERGEERNERTT